jgi:hypothetical protein
MKSTADSAHEAAIQAEAEAVARLPKMQPGDLIEAVTASDDPMTIRVRIDREPWQTPGHFGTVLCDTRASVVVKTDSIRVIDAMPPAPPAAANDVLAANFAPARHCEVLRDDVSYAMQWGTADGMSSSPVAIPDVHTRDEADAYVASVQTIADPGIRVRVVEVRLTHTAFPTPTTKSVDVDHGPAAAGTLRSGCRVDLHGAERLVWKVEYFHAGNYLRVHTVPPVGEHPGYFTFTLSPGDTVELISRGPAVDVAGEPVDTTR